MKAQVALGVVALLAATSCTAISAPTPAPSTPVTSTATPAPTALPTAWVSPTPQATIAAPAEITFNRRDIDNGDWDGFVIHAVNADGTNERVLLPGEHEVGRWSPDGRQLLVVSLAADGRVVPGIANADGSGYHDIPVEPPLNLGSGVWSPDGQWLALEGWADEPETSGLYLMHPDGSGLQRLVPIAGVPGGFSPDGTKLVFSVTYPDGSPNEVYVADVATGAYNQVGRWQSDLFPGFMKDGTSLYIPEGGRLHLVDLYGQELAVVRVTTGSIGEPRLSPDGTQFAVLYDGVAANSTAIATINVDGTGFRTVVDKVGVEESAPDWRPSAD
jgi:Tol biopolymer transport system component